MSYCGHKTYARTGQEHCKTGGAAVRERKRKARREIIE